MELKGTKTEKNLWDIGKRAGKGYNVRESVIDKIQTFFSVLSGHK